MNKSKIVTDQNYKNWLTELKSSIRNVQLKVAVAVNTELLSFYWELGAEIVRKQAESTWGDGLISQLSKDLSAEFPDMKGFSVSNLRYVRQWYLFYSEQSAIHQQAVGELGKQLVSQITSIPWGHNMAIFSKCKSITEALYYVSQTMENNWSRSVLVHQIEIGLYSREGKSVNNFAMTLPKPQSDLAIETLKDPYVFDFLTMTKDYNERDLEKGLIDHIAHFLLELGVGFAYLGRQFPSHGKKH